MLTQCWLSFYAQQAFYTYQAKSLERGLYRAYVDRLGKKSNGTAKTQSRGKERRGKAADVSYR